MGTHGLKRYDKKDLQGFLERSGYTDEHDFWSSLSGLSKGTTFDHMRKYLTDQGYSGTPHDQFRKFVEAQVGGLGTVYDMVTVWYEGQFGSEVSTGLETEAGDPLQAEDGSQLFTEGD